MEHVIAVSVQNKVARNETRLQYVCGNSDYVIDFSFDEEWGGYATKTARFVSGGEFIDVVFSGNRCKMPVITDTYTVTVGVFAGNLKTSTPAIIMASKSILCGGGIPADPLPDVYAQIMERLNAGGSDVTDEQIAQAVEAYMAEHPVQVNETDPTVPEWAKQPEKPTYTAEEIGALPSDTVIPPAYTLPTASADTLGGVRVGEGLRMDGDVLGVKPKGELELIAHTIVSEAETAVILIDTDKDGQPFDLKKAIVRYTAPTTDREQKGTNVGIVNKPGGSLATDRVGTINYGMPPNGTRICQAYGEINAEDNNSIFGIIGAAYEKNSTLQYVYTDSSNGAGLKCFEFKPTYNGNCFPVGTEIYVYGVRADD